MEFNMTKVRVGKVVTGKVFHVTDDLAYVDIQAFADGIIYKEGLSLDKSVQSCKDVLKEGDELTFKINKIDHENQRILLSRLDMLRQEKRLKFDEMADNERISVKVKKVTKGGLVCVHDGIEVFMPLSQIDVKRVNAEDFKNKTLECVVIENTERKVIVSRKLVQQADLRKAKKEAFDAVEVGSVHTGTVTSIMPYGAFVSLGDVEGLLHVSQISHKRIKDPKEVLNSGDTIEVKVIKKEKGRISLSAKALLPTPWESFLKDHKIGDEVEGTIVRKMKNAMLIEVAEGVVGILNSKDYSWNPRENFAGEVQVGDKVTVKILSIDEKRHKMSLSRKHLTYNPWSDVSVKKGEEVSGTIVELQSNGALVQVQGVNAFLPISEISDERINQVSDVLKIDQVINALVLEVDKRNWRMKVSIKALANKKEREMFDKYKEAEENVKAQTLGELFADKFKEIKKEQK
jgi:small subunit ribosomal protein S1